MNPANNVKNESESRFSAKPQDENLGQLTSGCWSCDNAPSREPSQMWPAILTHGNSEIKNRCCLKLLNVW